MKTPLEAAERQAFSERLHDALREAGIRHSPTLLAREYNLRSPARSVTAHAVRKWLFAEAMPTQAHLLTLAEIIGASPQWLRFGEGAFFEKAGQVSTPMPADISRMFEDIQLLDDRSRELVIVLVRTMLKQQQVS